MKCALCGRPGDVMPVPRYQIGVCGACWDLAEHGWPKDLEPRLMTAMADAGLLIPDRNAAGLLPRTYEPPADFKL